MCVVGGRVYAGVWTQSNNGVGTTPWSGNVFVSAPVSPGVRFHAVAVLDHCTFKLYLDGAQAASAAGVGRLIGHGGDVGIGGQNDDCGYDDRGDASGDKFFFKGVIDEVAVYNGLLTDAQVAAHHATGVVG
jgi:hypothetical protein